MSKTKVQEAVDWALAIAADDSHGYDQINRWGPDYDCSSLIISAYEHAGIPVKSAGATYTGNMREVFLKCGFEVVKNWNRSTGAGLILGDVLLNIVHHTEMCIGNGQLVKASSNEFGGIKGGKVGDQTGGEIHTGGYYVFSSGWDCALRYTNQTELYTGTPTAYSGVYDYAVTGEQVQPDYEAIDPYIVTVHRITKLLDFSKFKENRIIGVVIEAGYLFNEIHLKADTYVSPMLDKQVQAAKEAELPYGLYATVRARSVPEAREELKWLRIYIQKYVPPLGVWLNLDLANNTTVNDMIIDTYRDILVKSGLKGKIGLYCNRAQLSKVTWSIWKEHYLLWLIDHVKDTSELDTILTPEFFMLNGSD